MGEVVELGVVTSLPVPSEKLLRKAIEGGVTNVVIIGYDPEGAFWFASSDADGGDVLWLLEMAKRKLLDIGENGR
jgi:hypothetical protein